MSSLFTMKILLGLFLMALAPNTSLLKSKPQIALLNEVLELEPAPGLHFNLKATHCGTLPFILKTPLKVSCQPTERGSIEFIAGICDDKETFCKLEKFRIQVSGAKNTSLSKRLAAKSVVEQKSAPKDHHGFLDNQLELAQARAKKEKKFLLIDFSADWCPPCNYLEDSVFSEKEFLDATKNFVKVRANVDTAEAWGWVNQFKIQSYPTLVVATANLEEVDRLLGSTNIFGMLAWLENLNTFHDETLSTAENRLRTIPPSAPKAERAALEERVGIWKYRLKDYEGAVALLSQVENKKAKRFLLLAKASLAEDNKDSKSNVDALRTLLETFKEDSDWVWWFSDLAEKSPETAKIYLKQANEFVTDWEATYSKDLEKQKTLLAEVFEGYAEALGTLGEKDEAKVWYKKTAAEYKKLADSVRGKLAKGANQKQAICLREAEDFEGAKKIFKSLASEFSDEFTFNYNYGSTLYRLKEYKEARTYAEKALKQSFGNNSLRATVLLTKLDIAEGKKTAALKRITEALSSISLPKDYSGLSIRYTMEDLKSLRAEAEKK